MGFSHLFLLADLVPLLDTSVASPTVDFLRYFILFEIYGFVARIVEIWKKLLECFL